MSLHRVRSRDTRYKLTVDGLASTPVTDLRIGGDLDPATGERADRPTVLPSADLTTHGVIVGMTGSGKTGLGVVLIEEALAAGVPVLALDPKGDLTNLCLTFPALAPADFEPWLPPADVAGSGLTAAQYAERQARTWRDGLAGWQVGPDRIAALRAGVEFCVYTPGSAAGRSINVVGSLAAPDPGADPEDVAAEIDGYVSTVLTMVGIDADPLSSREHVLLSTLIQAAWSAGQDLDLATVLAQVQQPPLRKVGVLDLEQFFPAADRAAFAIRLNALLASPSFATWLTGDPIDIDAMLRTADGRPRCAIVTLAHLADDQRLSVAALLLTKMLTWTRRQAGSADLRALVFVDEVAGYLPPTANPPTKRPILTLLKQARAFGVGVVLSTQNPVDIDYKALSNAGTWLIGRLQTEQDKARLVDGLRSAAGTVDIAAVGAAISALGKRQFLLKRATADVATLTTTRWAMSYLRGPMMRAEIARLATAGLVAVRPDPVASSDQTSPTVPPATDLRADETPVAPVPAPGVLTAYVDPAAGWRSAIGAGGGPDAGRRLEAAVVARVRLRFDDPKAELVFDQEYEAVLHPLTTSPDPADFVAVDYDDRDLHSDPPVGAVYLLPVADIARKAWWTAVQKSLTTHLLATRTVQIETNTDLRLYSRIGESSAQFADRCARAAAERADAATAALRRKYEARLRTAQTRARSAGTTADSAAARHEVEHGTAAQVTTLLGGIFGGRRSRSSILTEARRSSASAARVEAAQERASTAQQAVADLERDLTDEIAAIDAQWTATAAAISTMTIPLERNDIVVADLRLVWLAP